MQQSFRAPCFEDIFRSIGRIVEGRHLLESSFHGGSNDTLFVGRESFRLFIRHIECVGFVDLILVVVLDVLDVIVASVASHSLFLRRTCVRGKLRVSLAWDDG